MVLIGNKIIQVTNKQYEMDENTLKGKEKVLKDLGNKVLKLYGPRRKW